MAFLGVDIGGTTTHAALIDDLGYLLGDASAATHVDGTVRTVLECVGRAAQAACDRVGISPAAIDAACFAVPGAVPPEGDKVICSPILGWEHETDIVPIAVERLDIPLTIENDALCAAVGESEFGVGNDCDDFILLKLGTGVGIAAVRNGRPATSSTEFGVWLSSASVTNQKFRDRACADALISHVEAAAARLGDPTDLSGLHDHEGMPVTAGVWTAARAGSEAALTGIDRYATDIARGIIPLVRMVHPAQIVIAGTVARGEELLVSRVVDHLGAEAALAGVDPVPSVRVSGIAPSIGAYGAALVALRRDGVDFEYERTLA